MFEDIRYNHDGYTEYDYDNIHILIDWENGESYFLSDEPTWVIEIFKSF